MPAFPPPHPAFAGATWPAIPQTQAATLLAIQQQLQLTQYLPPADLRSLQFRQLAELIAHIDRCVPFYGVSLRRAGIRPGQPITNEAWARVPILTRPTVQQAGNTLHATELPPGHGRTVEVRTSGSSGMPVTVRKTELEQFYWQSFTLREELWHGRDLGAKLMAIRRDDQRPATATGPTLRHLPDWGAPVATVYPTGPMLLLDYRCTIAEQAEALRRERPDYLLTFPSNLLALMRHMRAHDLAPAGLRGVRTAGEALSPETRTLCRELWGVDVTDCYSAAETGNLAFQCPDSPPGDPRYHVQSESALLEVLDPDGRPCAPGETGRVVVTALHNFAMPLIRYEIGDLAELGPPCPCGRTLPVLTRIPGRARDMLTLPGGAQRFPYYGHGALVRVAAIVQHQIVQKSLEEIEIRLVVRRPLTTAEQAQIHTAVAEGLGHKFRLSICYRDEITRGPGGKYAEFTSEITG